MCVRKVERTLRFELPLPNAGALLDPKVNTGVCSISMQRPRNEGLGMYKLAHLNLIIS